GPSPSPNETLTVAAVTPPPEVLAHSPASSRTILVHGVSASRAKRSRASVVGGGAGAPSAAAKATRCCSTYPLPRRANSTHGPSPYRTAHTATSVVTLSTSV